MVYVFRSNKAGGVLQVPWDKVFFHYGKGHKQSLQNWDLRGHVLSEDGKTVLDTFAFSVDSVDKESLSRHWEFLRRYMEQPIEKFVPSLDPPVEVCLPIADHKEPYVFGLKRFFITFHGWLFFQILISPLFFLFSLGRFVAMRTSTIPRWPADVEAACKVDPTDPFLRDASMNPPGTTYGWK